MRAIARHQCAASGVPFLRLLPRLAPLPPPTGRCMGGLGGGSPTTTGTKGTAEHSIGVLGSMSSTAAAAVAGAAAAAVTSSTPVFSLEDLPFDNSFIRDLPGDPDKTNSGRQVGRRALGHAQVGGVKTMGGTGIDRGSDNGDGNLFLCHPLYHLLSVLRCSVPSSLVSPQPQPTGSLPW